jgi:hypothetical protein
MIASFGAPTEFDPMERSLRWLPDSIVSAIDPADDLYVEMTFAETLDRLGLTHRQSTKKPSGFEVFALARQRSSLATVEPGHWRPYLGTRNTTSTPTTSTSN